MGCLKCVCRAFAQKQLNGKLMDEDNGRVFNMLKCVEVALAELDYRESIKDPTDLGIHCIYSRVLQ